MLDLPVTAIRRFVAIAAICLMPGLAAAQEKQDSLRLGEPLSVSGEPAKARNTPKPEWSIGCSSATAQAALSCSISQLVFVKKTQQRILKVTVNKPVKPGDKATILFALPHGLHLPNGVKLRVDQGKVITHPIQTSSNEGVYAATAMNDEFLNSLKMGNKLFVTVTSSNKQDVGIPVSLNGFTAAYNRILALK